MIFQADFGTVIYFVLIIYLGVSLILFVAGTGIMQMYANSKEWDKSFKIPLKINIIWSTLNLAIGIPLSFLYGDQAFIDYIRFGVNMVIGVIFVIRNYKKGTGESIQFVLIIQFILFIIAVVFGYIFGMLSLNILNI